MNKLLFPTLILWLSFYGILAQPLSVAEKDLREIKTVSSEPNNPLMPDAFSITNKFSSIMVVRLKHGTDILEALNETVKIENLENAVILCGIGSLTGYHIHSVSNTTFPSTNDFVKRMNKPMDLLTMQGYIMDGRVHAHITLSDTRFTTGGHLEPGCTVFTFAVITIGLLDDEADLSRFDDKSWR